MTKNWARLLDGRANVEVLAVGRVSRNKKEAAAVLIVDTWWIHEPARAGWFERLRELPDVESSHVAGDRDQVLAPQKIENVLQPVLVSR